MNSKTKTNSYTVLTEYDEYCRRVTYDYILKGDYAASVMLDSYVNDETFIKVSIECDRNVEPEYIDNLICMLEAVRDHYNEIKRDKEDE